VKPGQTIKLESDQVSELIAIRVTKVVKQAFARACKEERRKESQQGCLIIEDWLRKRGELK
jgi:hypothetical protein